MSEGRSPEAPQQPPWTQEKYDDEIDLFQLVETLWRQKWVVVAVTLLALAAGVAYVFQATPLYEVTLQVRPGKIRYDAKSAPEPIWSIDDIAAWIKEGQYRSLLRDLVTKENGLPHIEAQKSGNAQIVTLSLLHPDPRYGKRLLGDLYEAWVKHYGVEGRDSAIQMARKELEIDIRGLEEQLRIVNEVKVKQKIAEEKGAALLQERMGATLENTNELVQLRDALLARGDVEDLTLLLYTNIIQQNIYYVSQLQEQIANFKRRIFQIDEQISRERTELETRMERLTEEAQSLVPVELVGEPLASEFPVEPKKMLILALAVVAGGFLGVLAAFVRGAWQARSGR